MIVARGYTGSTRTVRRHLTEVRPMPKREAYLRVNPLIGEQAQIDWAHVGTVDVPGGKRSLWLFVIVLSWSRAQWGEFVFDLTADSLLRSLVRAAEYFGGTCRQWLVQYRVVEAGAGAKPTQASQVQISYKGTLPDGRVIVDTAQAAPNQPAGPVSIKVSEIPLSGLREALQMMPTGARWEVVMPGTAAYGTTIEAGEMANQAVVFDVKLVSIK